MKKLKTFLAFCAVLLAAQPAFAQGAKSSSATYNETRMMSLEEEFRALNGRLEQLEFSMRRLEQALQRMQGDVDTRLSKMETAVDAAAARPPAPSVSSPSAGTMQAPSIADVNGTLGALRLQDGKVTDAINNPKAPALPVVPPDYGLTPQEQYDRAFKLLRDAEYDQAEEALGTFIEKNPKDKLLDNAKYWYGETLYVRGRFDEAALAFADAYQQNPQGGKAPDSLLKLGLSLAGLGKIADACVTFSELKNKYPKASSTIRSRADSERAKLKCPAP